MRQHSRKEGFSPLVILLFGLATLLVFFVCVSLGSVSVSLRDIVHSICRALFQSSQAENSGSSYSIIISVRLPRVLSVALVGASLSLCGASMQGLLKNPLADGSTLGVSTGASLGAALAIALGFTLPRFPIAGTMLMAILFAFLSLLFILTLSYRLDPSLSTSTIILLGVIFSMFISSILSLVIAFASDKVKSIVFWTMGSLSGSSYTNVLILGGSLLLFGSLLLALSGELNAFALGEETAQNIGVAVRRVKFMVLICVSCLIGICVSIGGSIGFVGLVTPHMLRLITGPNHKKLLPASLFGGAGFLMLSDLAARTLLSPVELPIGVVTSLIGAVLFVIIFARSRREVR